MFTIFQKAKRNDKIWSHLLKKKINFLCSDIEAMLDFTQ